VEAIQVSAHTHERRRLLQAGDEGAVRAGRLRTRHPRDLDRLRETDDQIEMARGQTSVLPFRHVAYTRTGVVRDECAQRQCRRGDGVVRACHGPALSQTLDLVAPGLPDARHKFRRPWRRENLSLTAGYPRRSVRFGDQQRSAERAIS
jgi:hypothetical protein